MLSRSVFIILLYLFQAGCISSKIPQQEFMINDMDSIYLSGFVQRDNDGTIECLGYYSSGYQISEDLLSEDVKRAGLILDAKSILSVTNQVRTVFGNTSDSCSLVFNRTRHHTRRGRSALISVMNLVSDVKNEPYTKQDKPDTSLTSVVSVGSIMLKDQASEFTYKRIYDMTKRVSYDGWLVFRGDTLRARQVRDDRDDNGKLNKDIWGYYYWLQLVKNNTTYAAAFVSNTSRMKIYIFKGLSEHEKMMIAAFFSIIVFNS